MKKRNIVIVLLTLTLLLTFSIVIADDVYELYQDANDVPTSIGVIDLPAGTIIGGNPTINFIILLEETDMWVIGTVPNPELVTFAAGTKIHCEHGPGQPDPCDPF